MHSLLPLAERYSTCTVQQMIAVRAGCARAARLQPLVHTHHPRLLSKQRRAQATRSAVTCISHHSQPCQYTRSHTALQHQSKPCLRPPKRPEAPKQPAPTMTTLLDCTAVLPEILLLVGSSDHACGLPLVCSEFAAAWNTHRWLQCRPHAAYHSLCCAARQGRIQDAVRLLAIVKAATCAGAAGQQVWRSACSDALHHAACPSTTEALLAAGAEPQTLPGYSHALTAAARHGSMASVKTMLSNGHAVMRGHPALQAAVEQGHVGVLSALLEACSGQLHPCTLCPDWLSWLLVCAAKFGQVACIPVLVASGADQQEHFSRALRTAAACGAGSEGVVGALVAAGADVGVCGADALHEAAVRQHKAVARQLVEAGACARAPWILAWCQHVEE